MFVRGFRGTRGIHGVGDYVARQPSDWKLDNWIGQSPGGGLQTAPSSSMSTAMSIIPGVSNTTAATVGGVATLAALAAAAWYFFKK